MDSPKNDKTPRHLRETPKSKTVHEIKCEISKKENIPPLLDALKLGHIEVGTTSSEPMGRAHGQLQANQGAYLPLEYCPKCGDVLVHIYQCKSCLSCRK